METTRKMIVVGVDGTETGARALENALQVAARDPHAEVHAIRVVEPAVDPVLGLVAASTDVELEALKDSLQAGIRDVIAREGELRIAAVVAHVVLGAPARAIVSLAAQLDADLIVVGTHGRRGLRRALLGSVAEEVVRTAGCPVYAVRPKAHPAEDRVPAVEPLCDACAETRSKTKNAELWCAQHSAHHPRAHVYRYDERSTDSVRAWGFHA
jgi:nucleotide-binding universal stress UspA family protein